MINIEGFGEKDVKFYEIDGVEEFVTCFFEDNGITYSALTDKEGRELIPFSSVPIQDYFFDFNRNNFCFTRYTEGETNYESFHLTKSNKNNKYYRIGHFKGNSFNACRLVESDKNKYWFVETTIDNITKYCLYDVKKAKILTPPFTEISFEKEKGRVLALVTNEIYGYFEDMEEPMYLTTLATFIDKDGRFLAPLFDMKNDKLYPAIDFNNDENFRHYNHIINLIIHSLGRKYISEREHVDEVLANMFNNLYTEEELKPKEVKHKIKKFPSEV